MTLRDVDDVSITADVKASEHDAELVNIEDMLSQIFKPALVSMRICGTYFRRSVEQEEEDGKADGIPTSGAIGDGREGQVGSVREWRCTMTAGRKQSIDGYQIYSTVLLAFLWINTGRVMSAFTSKDTLSGNLFLKITLLITMLQGAIMQTTYFIACNTGELT